MKKTGQRGSAVLQLVIMAPVLLSFTLLCIAGGRLWLANQAVDAAAFDAARTASIARNAQAAASGARSTAQSSLTNRQIRCTRTEVSLDTSGFSLPVGTPATVQVTLACTVNLEDVTLPGMPSTLTIKKSATSSLDSYRERTDR